MLKLGSKNNYNGVFTPVLQRLQFLCLYSSTSKLEVDTSSSSSSSLLVNYLVNSLGFSKQQSLSNYTRVSNSTRANNATDFCKNADSVIHFLKQHDFELPHIRKIVTTYPRILSSNIDETLKPKFEFLLQELGFSGSELVHTIVANPYILKFKLSSPIETLRAVLGNDANVRRVLKRGKKWSLSAVTKYLIPNVELLENYGITIDRIQGHILRQPELFLQKPESLNILMNRVEHELDIPRDSSMFLFGVAVFCRVSGERIKHRMELFKNFGWTHSDVRTLIRNNPQCLGLSEANIKKKLEFYMNELGYKPGYLASNHFALSFSLDKRVLPRYKILMVLKEKGLIRTDYPLYYALCLTESKFVTKFVLPHKELHEVYAKLTGSNTTIDASSGTDL